MLHRGRCPCMGCRVGAGAWQDRGWGRRSHIYIHRTRPVTTASGPSIHVSNTIDRCCLPATPHTLDGPIDRLHARPPRTYTRPIHLLFPFTYPSTSRIDPPASCPLPASRLNPAGCCLPDGGCRGARRSAIGDCSLAADVCPVELILMCVECMLSPVCPIAYTSGNRVRRRWA